MNTIIKNSISFLLVLGIVCSLAPIRAVAQPLPAPVDLASNATTATLLYADNGSAKLLLRVAGDAILPEDFTVEMAAEGDFADCAVTKVNYDSITKIASLTFEKMTVSTGYTGVLRLRASYLGKNTEDYSFAADHVTAIEQEVPVSATNQGSFYEAYCKATKLADGSGLAPNSFAGLHNNDGDGQGMWMTAQNPGADAWAEVTFDKSYPLHKLYIWNYNQKNLIARGLKNVKLEYYNGSAWKTIPVPNAGDYPLTLKQSSGNNNMAATDIMEMNGIEASGLRITADPTNGVGSYGDSYFGLSEVKVSRKATMPYQVTVRAGNGSVVTSDSTTVAKGGQVELSVKVSKGYDLTALYVNGKNRINEISQGKLALTNIEADLLVVSVTHDQLGEGPFVFYIDPAQGNDNNNGVNADTPLKSLEPLRGRSFGPGDQILLKAGTTLVDSLTVKGSGAEGAPIVISSYGEGAMPILKMPSAEPYALNLTNVEHWEIREIAITSENSSTTDPSNLRAAIFIYNDNAGPLNHVYVMDCHIYDIPTYIPPDGGYAARFFGGIFVNIGAQGTVDRQNKFVDLQLMRNRIERTAQAGIYFQSFDLANNSWDHNLDFHSEQVQVSDNYVDSVGGDGIMVGWSQGAVIENNVVAESCKNDRDAYAALWVANLHDSVIQYNECYKTYSWADGMAFDDDLFCSGNTYQYNYSHHNEGGFFMSMGSSPDSTIRYNVSYDDGDMPGQAEATRLIVGASQGTRFYNNVIYTPKGNRAALFARGAGPGNGTFQNNIFYLDGNNPRGLDGGTWDTNLFYGEAIDSKIFTLPPDSNAILEDPLFAEPMAAGQGFASAKKAFSLRKGSPAIDAGVQMDHGSDVLTQDFYGNLFTDGKPDLGIQETNFAGQLDMEEIMGASNGRVVLQLAAGTATPTLEELEVQLALNNGRYEVMELLELDYDQEIGLLTLLFTPVELPEGIPSSASVKVRLRDEFSKPFAFRLNQTIESEYEISVVKATAGSTYPGETTSTDNIIDGSGLAPNSMNGLHGNNVWGWEMWMSDNNPGDKAWVELEFDDKYPLHNLYIWNYNQSGDTNWRRGMRDVRIEWFDGQLWQALSGPNGGDYPFQLAMAEGKPNMTVTDTIELGGVTASKLRITADPTPGVGNWAEIARDHYYGLSEVKVSVLKAMPYTVQITQTENGTVSTDKEQALPDEPVTLTTAPDEGYRLARLYINGVNRASEVGENGQLLLSVLTEDIRVKAQFVLKDAPDPDPDPDLEPETEIIAEVKEAPGDPTPSNTVNAPATTSTIRDTIRALADVGKLENLTDLPKGVAVMQAADGKSLVAVDVLMTSDSLLALDTLRLLSEAGSQVGLHATIGFWNPIEVLIPGGFQLEPGRVTFPMPYKNPAPSLAAMGELAELADKKLDSFSLGIYEPPVAVTVIFKTKLPESSKVAAYRYDQATSTLSKVADTVVKDGKVTFVAKLMGEFVLATSK